MGFCGKICRFLWEEKLLFIDFRTNCVPSVGEALMPPVGQYVFAAMPQKTVTLYRREAKMPPLQHGRTVLQYLMR